MFRKAVDVVKIVNNLKHFSQTPVPSPFDESITGVNVLVPVSVGSASSDLSR
ncbi:hypothetical protein K7432_015994 [Basidiobolus ranarum]|uniref:Uncharacterized protein n=1 Tax=Basidiobolus ranarum TaxID=34480 RepID=A0ABR2WFG4_9FUNG